MGFGVFVNECGPPATTCPPRDYTCDLYGSHSYQLSCCIGTGMGLSRSLLNIIPIWVLAVRPPDSR